MDYHRIHYLDASVLLKLVIKEKGTEAIENYMTSEYTSTFYTTSLCFAEALGELKSKYLNKEIDQETYFRSGDVLRVCINDRIKLADVNISSDTVFKEVEDIARQHRLDIVDAYQIVTVMKDYFSKFSYARPFLITADSDLAKAAREKGLRVWNCLTEPAPKIQ